MFEDKLLLIDFGGTQALSIARKLRAERFYCEVLPATAPLWAVRRVRPKGILLVGNPIGDQDISPCDPKLLQLGIPVLALGHSARRMAEALGGKLLGTLGRRMTAEISFADSPLFEGIGGSDRYLEQVDSFELPEGFQSLAFSSGGLIPAFGSEQKKLYALQFYPEANDPDGQKMLQNFAENICGCGQSWTMEVFLDAATARIQKAVGEGRALIVISGGVDSSVAAALAHRAIGDRLTCLFVDTGLTRKGDKDLVMRAFRDEVHMDLICVDATDRFFARLQGVSDPQEKRRIVRDELKRVISDEAARLGPFNALLQGTIYPDVIGGYWATGVQEDEEEPSGTPGEIRVLEPLKTLFKFEVREIGRLLGLSEELIERQPFPEAGLSVRCVGEVSKEKITMLRAADAIFTEEITLAGMSGRIWQYFAVLTGVKTMGIRPDGPCYEHTIALRAVSSHDAVSAFACRLPYDLLERVVQRITSEVPGVNRVVYDMTGKPTAMIEWE